MRPCHGDSKAERGRTEHGSYSFEFMQVIRGGVNLQGRPAAYCAVRGDRSLGSANVALVQRQLLPGTSIAGTNLGIDWQGCIVLRLLRGSDIPACGCISPR